MDNLTEFLNAVKQNDSTKILYLVKNGLNPNKSYQALGMHTPISYLVVKDKFDILQELYKNGYKIVEQPNILPLMELVIKDYYTVDQIKLLCDMGANLDEISPGGFTPFLNVCYANKLAEAQYLKQRGANIFALNQSKVNAIGNCLNTNFDIKFFIWLLQQGVSLYNVDVDGETVIDYMEAYRFKKEIKDCIADCFYHKISIEQLIDKLNSLDKPAWNDKEVVQLRFNNYKYVLNKFKKKLEEDSHFRIQAKARSQIYAMDPGMQEDLAVAFSYISNGQLLAAEIFIGEKFLWQKYFENIGMLACYGMVLVLFGLKEESDYIHSIIDLLKD